MPFILAKSPSPSEWIIETQWQKDTTNWSYKWCYYFKATRDNEMSTTWQIIRIMIRFLWVSNTSFLLNEREENRSWHWIFPLEFRKELRMWLNWRLLGTVENQDLEPKKYSLWNCEGSDWIMILVLPYGLHFSAWEIVLPSTLPLCCDHSLELNNYVKTECHFEILFLRQRQVWGRKGKS